MNWRVEKHTVGKKLIKTPENGMTCQIGTNAKPLQVKSWSYIYHITLMFWNENKKLSCTSPNFSNIKRKMFDRNFIWPFKTVLDILGNNWHFELKSLIFYQFVSTFVVPLFLGHQPPPLLHHTPLQSSFAPYVYFFLVLETFKFPLVIIKLESIPSNG